MNIKNIWAKMNSEPTYMNWEEFVRVGTQREAIEWSQKVRQTFLPRREQ